MNKLSSGFTECEVNAVKVPPLIYLESIWLRTLPLRLLTSLFVRIDFVLTFFTRRDTGRKVDDPEVLEAIRLTVINNLLQYHPESSSQFAMGVAFGVDPPKQQVDVDIATHISIYDDGPNRSLLLVETADRPGLLVDLVKIFTVINVNVESGEFDTEELLAKAKFHVSYKGEAIIKPLQQVLANSLRYFLRRPTTEEASF
ncbi:ACT domain-containing protein ACR11 [Citrus sinensis]|uniref:ACT domain-containing protein ACR11 n=1 Tax=Citrus sinensis TaxID=2711 RepID=A0ACB8JDX7_CITSI|nr:ACT domain-containing protein ACR11 [Citrus sinensis]